MTPGSTGSGYNDSFTRLSAGITGVGAPTGAPATYSTTIDTGAVGWVGAELQTVNYQSLLANLQYYFCDSVFFTGVYLKMLSNNSNVFSKAASNTLWDSKYASVALM
jgi:hypothetical protein